MEFLKNYSIFPESIPHECAERNKKGGLPLWEAARKKGMLCFLVVELLHHRDGEVVHALAHDDKDALLGCCHLFGGEADSDV